MKTAAVEIIFWISVATVFYAYIGYALLLLLLSRKKKKLSDIFSYPPLTIVVPVYNEEKFIRDKIANCFALEYHGTVRFLFVNDGSTDATEKIIGEHPQIEVLHLQKRSGKTAALNKAMEVVQTPVVVFTDANAMLNKNCLTHLIRHFEDKKVGGVSGEKKIFTAQNQNAVSGAEQLYWQYESFLKKADAGFYSIVGADGGLYAIRTRLFRPVNEDVILDDFFISVQVCEQGYVFAYEPEASAIETSSASVQEEQKRKIRISAGCFQALFTFTHLLHPFRNFRLFLVYFSHRVLRWIACPLLLPVIFFSNAFLFTSGYAAYYFLFLLQAAFYILAATAWVFPSLRKFRLLLLPYYFLFMNVSLYLGFYRFVKKAQPAVWEKTERSSFE